MSLAVEPQGMPQTNEEVIDLRKYFSVINRAKWRILLLAVLVSALTVFVVLNLKPVFSSRATLLIEAQQAKAVKIEEVYGMNSAQQEYYLTQFEILKSRSIAETVIDRLQLALHPDFIAEPSLLSDLKKQLPFLPADSGAELSAEDQLARAKEKLVQKFVDRLSIDPVRKTQLVNITFESHDNKLAAAVANAVGDAYIESQLEAKMGITQKANAWLGGRLGELRLRLDESEQALQDFRVREGLIDVAGVRSLGSQELERLGVEITQARAKKAQVDGFIRVTSQYGTDKIDRLESLPEITAHPGVQNVKKEVISAERKVSELGKIYGPKHPKLLAAKSELTTVQDNLRDQIRKLISGIENEAQTASQNLQSLETEMARAKVQYQDLSGKETEYQRLQREVETNRQLFDTFMARQKETEVAGDFNSAIARFTDRAMPATEPLKPKRKLIVVLAFIAALGFGVIVAFVMESLNDTIKTTQDVEQLLQQRALGIVPKLPGKMALKDINTMFFNTDQRQFSESIRSIRTSISLLALDKQLQVIEVTSSIPEEGKSTVSSNISFAFGQLERVLLIDADMRKPTIAKRFGLPAFQPGLANYLSETESLEECIVHDEKTGIDILAAGSVPLNPLELLSHPRFAALLTELRGKYSKIIIDTPPVQAVSDALVVSRFADAVLMVVKADHTRSGLIQYSLSKLIHAHARVFGVVLNDLDLVKAEKYYGSYGYYQYYAEKSGSLMIDVHCHILPAIDDGASDLTESLALLRLAVADGIKKMVATPHINPGYFDNNRLSINTALARLRLEVAQQQIPIQLAAAAEIRVTADLMPAFEQGLLPILGHWQQQQVLLLEFPHSHIPPGSDKLMKWLLQRGVVPMIAHPERNRDVQSNPRLLQPLIQAGCLFQLTASSLLGDLGDRHQACAEQLLQQRLFTVMATDSHNIQRRPPRLQAACDRVRQLTDEHYATQLVLDHPAMLTAQLDFGVLSGGLACP